MVDKRKTILAIDDDITALNTIRTVLEGAYEVSLAKNIDIAKTILKTTKIDMILLDMNMPDASGMDFLEFARKDRALYHIPVIIVSSQGTSDVILNAKKMGAVDFVVKPITPNILAEKIRLNLKTISVKVSRESLERRLRTLSAACVRGRSDHVEKIVRHLEQVYFEHTIDPEITAICKNAKEMEYNLANKMIEQLLTNFQESA